MKEPDLPADVRQKRFNRGRKLLAALVTLTVAVYAEQRYEQRMVRDQAPMLGAASGISSAPLPRPQEEYSTPRTRLVWADEKTAVRTMFYWEGTHGRSPSHVSLTRDRYVGGKSPHFIQEAKFSWPFAAAFEPAAAMDWSAHDFEMTLSPDKSSLLLPLWRNRADGTSQLHIGLIRLRPKLGQARSRVFTVTAPDPFSSDGLKVCWLPDNRRFAFVAGGSAIDVYDADDASTTLPRRVAGTRLHMSSDDKTPVLPGAADAYDLTGKQCVGTNPNGDLIFVQTDYTSRPRLESVRLSAESWLVPVEEQPLPLPLGDMPLLKLSQDGKKLLYKARFPAARASEHTSNHRSWFGLRNQTEQVAVLDLESGRSRALCQSWIKDGGAITSGGSNFTAGWYGSSDYVSIVPFSHVSPQQYRLYRLPVAP